METFLNTLLDRISAYDFFNNLVPGILYCIAVDKYLNYSLLGDSLWANICICYVAGICISRVGSCLEDKLIKSYSKYHIQEFLKRAPYNKYLEAEKKESKITLLNTVNNTYRSLMALALCYYITVFYQYTLGALIYSPILKQLFIATGLFALFAYSVKKQTRYIRKCVQHTLLEKNLQTLGTHSVNK